MFNRKLKDRIASLERSAERSYDRHRDDYWALRHDLDALLRHLGLELVSAPAKREVRKRDQ